ncbi:hypothetical protein F4780DRAFT_453309 [Xylariomycetidae sp. FL0641]|nr:hypothetical protein F4780DRAFT_453309 [Xylariomycetidae sp. FL0641]
MKTTSFTAALLASVVAAKPHARHGHHHNKRDLVVEWETVWETATVLADESTTQTILPAEATTSSSAAVEDTGAAFLQTPPATTTSEAVPTSTPEPSTPTVISTPTVEAAVPSSTSSSVQTTFSTSASALQPPPAPTTSTTEAPVVVPTTTAAPVEPSTTSSYVAPPPATSAVSGGSGGGDDSGIPFGVHNAGEMTYYITGPGACGYNDPDGASRNIVAIPVGFWNSISTLTSYGVNQPANPLCDKTITITGNGRTTTALIRDQCPSCADDHIDVSEHTFIDLFDSTDAGTEQITWWVNES